MILEVERYDLFVVYADADALWVHGYLLPLLDLPRRWVITKEQFVSGAVIAEEFERAVQSSRHTVVVLSPAFLADEWATFGRQLAVHAAVADGQSDLIAVMVRSCRPPIAIGSRVTIDFTDESSWEQGAARLRERLGQPAAAEQDVPCPYPGMVPYTSEDADGFFGRDLEVEELVQRARRFPSLYIIGPSGSGKSSLVSAGLVPELHRREPGRWLTVTMRPGSRPMRALAGALGGAGEAGGDGADPATMVQSLLAGHAGRRVLLVVDQLEELFSLAPPDEQRAFVRALLDLRQAPDCVVVPTLRADFYPELMGSELWPVVDAERLEVVPLRGDALRQAIELPASRAGVYMEPALVERLMADAADEPGALPPVQETLRQLWDRDRRRRRLLTLAAYDALGSDGRSGLAVALARTADACMSSLDPAQRDIARRVLLRLIQLGEGRDDTRRQQSAVDLRAVNDDRDRFERTLRQLAEGRLLTLDKQPGTGATTVDLAHEALITSWPVLRELTDQGRADELLRRRIEKDAKEWWEGKRDHSALYRPGRLKAAMAWTRRHPFEPSERVADFLAAGRRFNAAVRAVRVVAIAFVAVVLVTLAVPQVQAYAWRQQTILRRPMVQFPPGLAVLGAGSGSQWAERRVRLAAFSLDRYEVSNRDYRLCVRARRCSEPVESGTAASYLEVDPRYPVVFVTARQAAAFCHWLGRRLPSAAEWERAARGTSGRPWPWGREAVSLARANIDIRGEVLDRVAPVDEGAFLAGATPAPERVMHLIGNVWEWTATPDPCKPSIYGCPSLWNGRDKIPAVTTRGGGFTEPVQPLTQANSLGADAKPVQISHSEEDLGFRCAQSG